MFSLGGAVMLLLAGCSATPSTRAEPVDCTADKCVSLTFDGIPLNDTGNYAIYTNQQLDPELIERASVNTGSTDVDSPTASATGGTINYVTRRPAQEFGGWIQGSLGDFNYRRAFGFFNTGFGQIYVSPAGEQVFLIPNAFAMADHN